jgi:hypothetical protein
MTETAQSEIDPSQDPPINAPITAAELRRYAQEYRHYAAKMSSAPYQRRWEIIAMALDEMGNRCGLAAMNWRQYMR